jgi:hypothetical protein
MQKFVLISYKTSENNTSGRVYVHLSHSVKVFQLFMARVVNIGSVMILHLGQSMNSCGSSAQKGRGGSWVVR